VGKLYRGNLLEGNIKIYITIDLFPVTFHIVVVTRLLRGLRGKKSKQTSGNAIAKYEKSVSKRLCSSLINNQATQCSMLSYAFIPTNS